jgi:signal transduction histidine kinase
MIRLVRDAVQTSTSLIEAARHQFSDVVPDAPVWVDADPTRMTRVLSNLLDNPLKYTDAGDVIEERLAREGKHAVLSVADNGVGVEPDMLGRLFDPFVQVSSASHMAHRGLGRSRPDSTST